MINSGIISPPPPCISSLQTSFTNNRYSSTFLRSTSELNDQLTANDDNTYPQINDKPKPRTRKQRSRHAKEYPLQRIDKVLADRGLGTRSKTFELAKSGRIATAASPDGEWRRCIHNKFPVWKYILSVLNNYSFHEVPFEERTVIRGPKQKVRSNAILFIDGKLIPGPAPLLMVYHKPKFMLSVMEDDKKYLDQQRRHLGQVLHPRYARAGMFNMNLLIFTCFILDVLTPCTHCNKNTRGTSCW